MKPLGLALAALLLSACSKPAVEKAAASAGSSDTRQSRVANGKDGDPAESEALESKSVNGVRMAESVDGV